MQAFLAKLHWKNCLNNKTVGIKTDQSWCSLVFWPSLSRILLYSIY